jgi:hypothetical protein
MRLTASSIVSCIVVFAFLKTGIAAPPDPLRLLPNDVTLVLKVEKPRELVESIVNQGAYRSYQELPQVREFLESAGSRRFFQVLSHIETRLGAKWPELLDQLSGGGMALGIVTGSDPAPALLVIQGSDEKKTAAAFECFLQLFTDELARQSKLDKALMPQVVSNAGVDVLTLGDDFFVARTEATIVIANKRKMFDSALSQLKTAGPAKSVLERTNLQAARRLLGGDPLAWLWFDLQAAKQDKAFRDFLETARKEILNTLVVGATVDAVRRSEYLAVGLFRTETGLKLTGKLPAKRAELPGEFALHVPMKPDTPGSLPLIELPGMLYSQSFYLDLASLWTDRKRLLNDQILMEFEKGVADISKFIPGTTLHQLLEMSGPHHRLVAIERGTNQYKTIPDVPLPEMALVSSMKDPQFGKSFGTTIRTAAVVASLNFGLTMSETKQDDVGILSYRFSETKPLPADPTNIRFNFVPSFAVVDGYWILASSPQLVNELIAEVRKPISPAACSPAVWRGWALGSGAASGLNSRPVPIITSAVLSQGIGLAEARNQIRELAKFLNQFGTIRLSLDHTTDAYVIDLVWNAK